MKKPFRDFDLPKHHLTKAEHYVPPRARRESEVDRRHGRPRGTLLAEYQANGAAIMAHMLQSDMNHKDQTYAHDLLSASAYNSAWYGIAHHGNTMRKRLKLPYFPDGFDADEHAARIRGMAVVTARHAGSFATAIAYESTGLDRTRLELGRSIGQLSLGIACKDIAVTDQDTPWITQDKVRIAGLIMMQNAQAASEEIGSPPSLAQLPDIDSDLSLHIRRTAPNGVYQAYLEALDVHRMEV